MAPLPPRLFVSQPSLCSYNVAFRNSHIFQNAGGSPSPPALSHAVSSAWFSSSSLFSPCFFGYLTYSARIPLPSPRLHCFTLSSWAGLSVLSSHPLKWRPLLLCFLAQHRLICLPWYTVSCLKTDTEPYQPSYLKSPAGFLPFRKGLGGTASGYMS